MAIVLAVFMGGLAAGSAYFSRWSKRGTDPISTYAVLELLAGVGGALSLAGLSGVHSLYLAADPAMGGSALLLLGIRMLGAAWVLFLPTFLLGGTFPVLVFASAPHLSEVARRVSQLYWINSAGAVLGTLLAGFVLLPTLGLRLTISAAAILNGLASLLAALVRDGKPSPRKEKAKITTSRQPSEWRLLLLCGLAGCTAFAYEIGWTRLLATTIGSSTYAFTLMLATFLAGIAAGSATSQCFVSRSAGAGPSLTKLAWVQIVIGLTTLSSLVALHWLPSLIPPLLQATGGTFGGLLLTQFVIAALAVFPTAAVFGFHFPLLIGLVRRSGDEPTSVGMAYAANTIGAIFGSLLAGFWLVQWLGSFRLLACVAAVHLLLALWIHLRVPPRRLLALDVALLVAVVAIASSPFFYNPSLLSLSAVLYGRSYQGRLTLAEIAATKAT